MTAPGEKTGGCHCGAVRFTARDVPDTASICHCKMCRRWTGSALVGVSLPEGNVTWEGEAHIKTLQSTRWAERAWCQRCGSHLWFRVTLASAFSGEVEIPLGLFDDPDGFVVTSEIYIDKKPDAYAFDGADSRTQMTRAECVAKFSVLGEDEAE